MPDPALRLTALAVLAVAASAVACSGSLVDHGADPAQLTLVCAKPLVECDGLCMSCTAPTNGQPACVAGSCGFDCDAGYHSCDGSTCTPEGPASCGPSCTPCAAAAPANASPACGSDHACTFVCDAGYLRSGSGCQRAVAVSAGYNHACALLADGHVRCWGAGDSGQLGNGTTVDSAIPVDVTLPGPATAVAAGYEHTCALVSGVPYCWGDNTFGELGDGTTASHATPGPVPGLPPIASISGGGGILPGLSFGHTCAITQAGALWCWGANGSGQLGDGSTSTRLVPVRVAILPAGLSASRVACGERHTCVLGGAGAVYCFGANDSGQLGLGTTAAQVTPATATLASGAVVLATGLNHVCAVIGGGLTCWGLNSSGQVDPVDLATGAFLAPRSVALGTFTPTGAAGGRDHTCVVDVTQASPAAQCFGADNAGQLGGPGIQVNVPLLPPGPAASVTSGSNHSCALSGDGGVQCWGASDRGQTGTGTLGPASSPPAYVSGG